MAEPLPVDRPDAFVCGAVGEPGQRTFYLQARIGTEVVTLKVEKEQVAALGRYLSHLVDRLVGAEPDRDIVGLVEPLEPLWAVGDLAVVADEDDRTILIAAEELEPFTEEPEGWRPGGFSDDDIDELLGEGSDRGEAHITITAAQAAAFAEQAISLVESGRPLCRLCGRPMEADRHDCPRWN